MKKVRATDCAESYGAGISWVRIVWWQQVLPKQTPVFYIPLKEMFKCPSLNHNQVIVVVEGYCFAIG